MQVRDPPFPLDYSSGWECPVCKVCDSPAVILWDSELVIFFLVALGNWWHWWCLKAHCSWGVFILCVLGLFSWCAAAPMLSCSRNPKFALPGLLDVECGALEEQVCSWDSACSSKSSSSAEGIIVTIVSEVLWHLFIKLLQNVHRVDPLF